MERILQARYRIVRPLGRGGSGTVYLCDDLRLPGKQWAIKQLNAVGVADDDPLQETFEQAFEREAATLSRLRHPNLPLVIDHFKEQGEHYLVIEYVDGENLAHYVRRRGPLSETEAFERGRSLAEILVYLHGIHPPIIFRDLKPENVMIDQEGKLKLIDFGLARRFVPGKRSDTVPSGSVGYAAPEQWEDLSQTDERSDVYSWGATLIFLVSGKIPSPQYPLSCLRAMEAPLSPRGVALLTRCVKPRPGDRIQTAADLLARTQRHLEALATGDRGASPDGPEAWETSASARDEMDVTGAFSSQEMGLPRGTWSSPEGPIRPTAPPSPPSSGVIAREPRGLKAAIVLLAFATAAFLGILTVRLVGSSARMAPRPSPAAGDDGLGVGPYRARQVDTRRREAGRRLYQQGRWAEAIDALDKATTLYPQDAEAHILKEDAYVRLSRAPFVRIPFIGSATGPDAPDWFPHLYGLALAQADINARGGIDGRKVILDCYDDESSTSHCLQIAEKLVSDAGVLVVLGPTNSQRTLACAPIFNAAHCNLVTPTASSEKIWESGRYVFSAGDLREPLVRSLARYVVRAGHHQIAVLRQDTSRLSDEMARIFESEVKRDGGTCLDLPPYGENQTDFSEQIDALQKTPADMIFLADYRVVAMVQFASQLRARGITTPLCSQTVAFARALIEDGGKAVDGLLITSNFHPQANRPKQRAFMAAFRRKFGDITPTYPVPNSYDTLEMVAQAMGSCTTRDTLNTYFHATGVTRPAFDGVGGRFALGKCLNARPVWLIEVKNGRFRLLGNAAEEMGAR